MAPVMKINTFRKKIMNIVRLKTSIIIFIGLIITLAACARGNNIPMPPFDPEVPAWPEDPPANWMTFHLAHPGPGEAIPGDPNPAFDYKGRYHLHYIYNHNGANFAHVSSDDMVRWQWHPTVLSEQATGHGMFSGTGFFTKDGTPAMIYHGAGSERNWIRYALDDQLNSWSEPHSVIPRTEHGEEYPMGEGGHGNIRHWDPDLWLMNDTYYAYSGGRNPQLMKSCDLENWTYLGDLLHPDYPQYLGVPKDEDISCGNMFRIGDKWMLLCISHALGARYYLGDFKNEKYLPETHHMMSFGNNSFFAPESFLTKDGRRVMWAWLMSGHTDDSFLKNLPIHPTGVQSLPRELELSEDGVLRIRPLRELASLRYDPISREVFTVAEGNEVFLEEITGDAIEMEVTFAWPLPAACGIDLLGSDYGTGSMRIITGGGRDSVQVGTTQAPFTLKDGEDLTLRVFIDKNLVEVFINDRQAAVYAPPDIRENPNIHLFAEGGEATVKSLKAWKMHSIYINHEESKKLLTIAQTLINRTD
jgi:beta-fructofuranosidase